MTAEQLETFDIFETPQGEDFFEDFEGFIYPVYPIDVEDPIYYGDFIYYQELFLRFTSKAGVLIITVKQLETFDIFETPQGEDFFEDFEGFIYPVYPIDVEDPIYYGDFIYYQELFLRFTSKG